MLRSLTKIENHGVYRLHEDVLLFFQSCIIHAGGFNETLFSNDLWEVIQNAHNLSGYFESCFNSLNDVGMDKQAVYDNLVENNRVAEFCQGEEVYSPLAGEDFNVINQDISDLYKFLWSSTLNNDTTVDRYGDLQNHYRLFFDANCIPSNLCPFCGLEWYIDPDLGRDDYDHYLHQKLYPLLRINFDNLVPMPGFCNGKYVKHVQDVLREKGTGISRRAYYPYGEVEDFTTSISCNNMFSDSEEWLININKISDDNDEEFKTWKTVFKIESRYRSEIITKYQSWILELKSFNQENIPENYEQLLTAIDVQLNSIEHRATELGSFLHKLFWEYVKETDEIIKDQILFILQDNPDLAP